jgi:hypothetical protein
MSTFLHSTSTLNYSDCSGRETLEIPLGFQKIKAIDDGGMSMYFQHTPLSSKESRRVVLSVEVVSSPHSINLGKTEKTCKGKQRGHCKSSCCSNLR